jgi:mTERF domain-containing protein
VIIVAYLIAKWKLSYGKTRYYLPIFGSFGSFLRGSKYGFSFLSSDLEKVVKPNVAFLQECGVDACDLLSMRTAMTWILGMKPERVRALALRAQALSAPRGSGMFRQALHAVAFLDEQKIDDKVGYLKKTLRWSDDEVGIAVCKTPLLLLRSMDMLQIKSEFLLSEVGLEPAYIAHRPVMLGLSLEGRLRPRYYVVKFLKENRLLGRDMSYFSSLVRTVKVFFGEVHTTLQGSCTTPC